MSIQHNILAIGAERHYGITTHKRAQVSEKLSSGYKINRAADDAAGLAISEKMRRQIRGLSRGVQNTEEGISLCQVADGALNEVQDIVHRLNMLSVQAANGTNERSDREKLQEEVDQLLQEINRISDTTTFNGQNLFGGAAAGEVAHFDSSRGILSAPESIAKFIREAGTADAYMKSDYADPAIVAALIKTAPKNPAPMAGRGPHVVATTASEDGGISAYSMDASATTYTPGVSDPGATPTPYTTPRVSASSTTPPGVSAPGTTTPSATTLALTPRATPGTFNITSTTGAALVAGTDYDYADGILTIKKSKAMTIEAVGGTAALENIKITSGIYANITLKGNFELSGNYTIPGDFFDGSKFTLARGSLLTLAPGSTLSLGDSSVLTLDSSTLYIPGRADQAATAGKVTDGGTSGKITGRPGSFIYAPSESNVEVKTKGGEIKQNYLDRGDDPYPGTEDPQADISAYAPGGRRDFRKWWIQSGSDARDGMYVYIDAMNVKTLGLLGLNVTTQPNADRAICSMDGALAYVSALRSRIGAQQNRLEHIVLNENNIVENTAAAESRVRDVDMAEGMAAFSMSDIIVRAGETMLAQANTSNAGVMALLR